MAGDTAGHRPNVRTAPPATAAASVVSATNTTTTAPPQSLSPPVASGNTYIMHAEAQRSSRKALALS